MTTRHPSTPGAELLISFYDDETDGSTIVHVRDSHPWRPVPDLVAEVADSILFLAPAFADAYKDLTSDASLIIHLLRIARGGDAMTGHTPGGEMP